MTGLTIVYTNHAMDRIRERFGDRPDAPLPSHRTFLLAASMSRGFFRVRRNGVVFVCRHDEPGTIVVLTVMRQAR